MGNTNTKEEEKKLGSVVVNNNSNNQPVQNTQNNSSTLKGVDANTQAKMNSSFTASDTYNDADADAKNALGNYKNIASKTNIISNNVWNTLNSSFSVPTAVTEADAYLSNQLKQIQSGKTSYTDQVKNMMSQIQNREDFSYDVDNDPLFQQALSSAMNSGKQAMQNTMGQAAALTGGYGSSYATTAGNQAYNSFIQDAYDNLPQYYQMAMEAYQMEGDEMYRQLEMFNNADSTEYARMVNAYDTTSAYRDRRYDEAYTQFRDSKSDAFNMANLQLSEHGQLASDALNLYNASSSYAENIYQKEYTKWSDEVNQAMQYGQMLNNDYWQQTTFDEDVRQYEQNFAEEQRQFDETYAQNDEHFYKGLEHESTENQLDRDFTSDENQKDRDFTSSENQADRDWKTEESQKDRDFTAGENQADRDWKTEESQKDRDFTAGENQLDRDWKDADREDSQNFTASENQKDRNFTAAENAKYKNDSSKGDESIADSIPKDISSKASKFKTNGELNDYLAAQVNAGNISEDQADYLYSVYETPTKDESFTGLKGRTWTLVDDGGSNGGGGIDKNGVVRDQYGNEYTMQELYDLANKTTSEDEAKAWILQLQKDTKVTKNK